MKRCKICGKKIGKQSYRALREFYFHRDHGSWQGWEYRHEKCIEAKPLLDKLPIDVKKALDIVNHGGEKKENERLI